MCLTLPCYENELHVLNCDFDLRCSFRMNLVPKAILLRQSCSCWMLEDFHKFQLAEVKKEDGAPLIDGLVARRQSLENSSVFHKLHSSTGAQRGVCLDFNTTHGTLISRSGELTHGDNNQKHDHEQAEPRHAR